MGETSLDMRPGYLQHMELPPDTEWSFPFLKD